MEESHQIVTVTSRRCRSVCRFKWEIDDFDSVCPRDSEQVQRITSPAFSAGEDIGQKTQWCLSISGLGGDITCSLYRLSAIEEETHPTICKYKISIGSDENGSIVSANGQHKFKQQEGDWGCEILKIPGLYDVKGGSLLNDRKLGVDLHMEVGANMDCSISTVQSNKRKFNEMTMETLQKDFQHLFQSNEFSDIKIKCGDQLFHCHKLILSARSRVLKTMLESEMSESVNNEIVIQDLDPKTLGVILHYIYTGKVNLPDSDCWTEVIHGAEKYDLVHLKNFCFDQMIENMNEENVGSIVVAAHSYNAQSEVKEVAEKFYKSNIEKLMEKESFRKIFFENPTFFYTQK